MGERTEHLRVGQEREQVKAMLGDAVTRYERAEAERDAAEARLLVATNGRDAAENRAEALRAERDAAIKALREIENARPHDTLDPAFMRWSFEIRKIACDALSVLTARGDDA